MPEDGKREVSEVSTFWSGVLTFGLVTVPVGLYPGVRSGRVSLRMVDENGTPLRRLYFCPEHGGPIEGDEIVRGYPLDGDEHVVVTDEELEGVQPEKSREIDLREFVGASEIDPLYFQRAYYLAPTEEGVKAYRLLAQAMERSGRAGIATFVMRGKEYLVAILAEDGILRAETLRFHDEIRSAAQVGVPEEGEADPDEVSRWEQLIDARSEDALPVDELHDPYAERLEALVRRKRESGEDVVEPPEEAEDSDVIDLVEALKRSLDKRPVAEAAEDGRLEELTKEELYQRAKELEISGRSSMSKRELVQAIRKAS